MQPELASEVLKGTEGRADILYAVVVIIIVGAVISGPLLYTYLRLVIIPNNKANRESAKGLAEATSAIAKILGENHIVTTSIKKDTGALKVQVKQLTNCVGAGINAIDKIGKHTGVDIAKELGVMQGSLLQATEDEGK